MCAQRNRRRPGEPLSRDRILATAEQLIERDGSRALSMRKLADELGIAPTTIYWHVGNQDALLQGLVERFGAELAVPSAEGDTPGARLLSIAERLRAGLLSRPRLLELLLSDGRLIDLYLPARDLTLRELRAAGLPDADAIRAVRALLICISGFVWSEVRLEQVRGREETNAPNTSYLGLPVPDDLLEHAEQFDMDDLFEFTVTRFLTGVLEGAAKPA
jgi:TetR/AcrR family transcriptional regulator, tetracycline repressor protein